jgi:hypothetical protein
MMNLITYGQTGSYSRIIKSFHVVHWTKQSNLTINAIIGFHALETFSGVMEAAGGRGQGQVLVWGDLGDVPSSLLTPGHFQHVIIEVTTKHKAGIIRFGSRFVGEGNPYTLMLETNRYQYDG